METARPTEVLLVCTIHRPITVCTGTLILNVLTLAISSRALPILKKKIKLGELLSHSPSRHLCFCDAYTVEPLPPESSKSHLSVLKCTCAHLHNTLIQPDGVTYHKDKSEKLVGVRIFLYALNIVPGEGGRHHRKFLDIRDVLGGSSDKDKIFGWTPHSMDVLMDAIQRRIRELFKDVIWRSGIPLESHEGQSLGHADIPRKMDGEQPAPVGCLDCIMEVIGLLGQKMRCYAVTNVSCKTPCPLSPACTCARWHSLLIDCVKEVMNDRDPSGEAARRLRIDLHDTSIDIPAQSVTSSNESDKSDESGLMDPTDLDAIEMRIQDSKNVSTSGSS